MTFVLFFVVSLESSIGKTYNETTMSLRHRVIDSIIVGSPHPTQLRKDLKEASYPDSIWSMIEKRLPHEVLKRDKSGVYHLLDEDGKVMPGLRSRLSFGLCAIDRSRKAVRQREGGEVGVSL